MTRRDQGIVAVLVAIFAALGILISLPPADRESPAGALVPSSAVAIDSSDSSDSSASAAIVGASSPQASPADGVTGASRVKGTPGASGGSAGKGSPAGTGAPAGPTTANELAVVAIRHGVVGTPTSINPLTARTQPDRDLVALVFSGLMKLGPKDTVVPDLADRWSVDSTGAHWTFRIRSGARWHDGDSVTADDVVFTLALLRDPGYTGPSAGSWSEITVKKIDAQTVRFDLRTPLGDFLQLARQPLLPAHLLRNVPIDGLVNSAFSAAPVGSGPYRLIQWDATSAVLKQAAIALTSTTGTAPSAAQVVPPRLQLLFYPTATALADAYRAGELDMADGLPAAAAKELDALPGTRLVRNPRATLTAVLLNLRTSHPTVRDQQVRQALLMAVDRVKLVQDVMGGLGNRADSLIPPTSWAYVTKAARAMPFDRSQAARLLRADGWRLVNGKWHTPGAKTAFSIEVITTTNATNAVAWEAAQFVARSWRTFGITVKVVALEPNVLVGERLSQANFSAAVVDINIGLDPDLYPLLASRQAGIGGSNLAGVQSLVLDELLMAARKPGTLAQRRGAFAKLETFLAEAQVTLPLAFRDAPLVVSDRVLGPSPHLQGDLSDRFWDVLTWRLASAG